MRRNIQKRLDFQSLSELNFSLQGDIVAFGIEEYPKERVNAQEFIDLVKAQEEFASVLIRFVTTTVGWKRI